MASTKDNVLYNIPIPQVRSNATDSVDHFRTKLTDII